MAIAIVNSTSASDSGGSGGNITSPSVNMTGANFLVAAVASLASVTSVIDSTGSNGNWTPLTEQSISGQFFRIFYKENATVSGSMTITVNGTSIFTAFIVWGFSGVQTAGSQNIENGNTEAVSTTVNVGGILPTTNSVLITGLGFNQASTITVDSGFDTFLQQINATGNHTGVAGSYKIATGGSVSVVFTTTVAQALSADISGFLPDTATVQRPGRSRFSLLRYNR
jgi:hypothetical protein